MKGKEKLNKAFRELRKAGYVAKQNYWCCQSCAWASLSDEKNEYVVFYHKQDGDDLKEKGECRLAWSGDGYEIKRILEDNGVKVGWDGSDDQRIEIDIN